MHQMFIIRLFKFPKVIVNHLYTFLKLYIFVIRGNNFWFMKLSFDRYASLRLFLTLLTFDRMTNSI